MLAPREVLAGMKLKQSMGDCDLIPRAEQEATRLQLEDALSEPSAPKEGEVFAGPFRRIEDSATGFITYEQIRQIPDNITPPNHGA